jgi:hypothetical protein
LAVLKLSGGDPAKINVSGANEDPGDMIEWAEHPEGMQLAMQNRKLRPEEKDQVEGRDWRQYMEWLVQGLK